MSEMERPKPGTSTHDGSLSSGPPPEEVKPWKAATFLIAVVVIVISLHVGWLMNVVAWIFGGLLFAVIALAVTAGLAWMVKTALR